MCNNPFEPNSKFVQVETISQKELNDLKYHCKVSTLKLKSANNKYAKSLSRIKDLEHEVNKNSVNLKILNKITENAQQSDEKAMH